MQAGTFTLGSGAVVTTPTLNVTGGAIAGVGTLNGSLNYTNATSSVFGGQITGAGSTLTMNNASAVLALTSTNTYSGATTVNGGCSRRAWPMPFRRTPACPSEPMGRPAR